MRDYLGVISLSLLLFALADAGSAGVYKSADDADFEPFIVVHPPGYDGSTGGVLEVRVCAPIGLQHTGPAIREAILRWNERTPTVENCRDCELWEEPANPAYTGDPFSMSSVLIHEIGHCIFGLGHINWDPDTNSSSSFTNTANPLSISEGTDGIRGTADDVVTPLPGADVIHWFRTADNNPFVVDDTVIDSSTYSRRILDLMALGDLWTTSANRAVGDSLGEMNTQAVMYSLLTEGRRYQGLAADDVYTVAYGMTGMDEIAGTSDDYTVNILFDHGDCSNADLEIEWSAEVNLGNCLVDLEALPTSSLFDIHHVIVPFFPLPRLRIRVSSDVLWDVIFGDAFESGDLSRWTTTKR